MIKRRFYRQDRGDRSDVSSSSSSDSDSLPEEEEEEEEEEAETGDDEDAGSDDNNHEFVRGSGYEGEDGSVDEITAESSDEDDTGNGKRSLKDRQPTKRAKVNRTGEMHSEESNKPPYDSDKSLMGEADECILKIKSVFKCRICPRVVCLSEASLMAHLESKRHARSKKLLKEGRLKLTLNSDGELEEEQETHAERHARIVALAQKSSAPKKSKGRQRQARRRKRKLEREARRNKTEQSKNDQPKSVQPKVVEPKETKQSKDSPGRKKRKVKA